MSESMPGALSIAVRFPLGVYHAQSSGSFAEPEWPPHPVRLIAALVAAAASLPDAARAGARDAIDVISACTDPPAVTAPRVSRADLAADGVDVVPSFRGASRWAPRNHQLSELAAGVHPRDLGRVRAEVSKVGVGIGAHPVVFTWPLELTERQLAALRRAAEELTVLGTSRSPAVIEVSADPAPEVRTGQWRATTQADRRTGAVDVRVPTEALPRSLDGWHARRAGPLRRNGSPPAAGFVPPVALGRSVPYRHSADVAADPVEAFDPDWWGEMLVVAIDRERSEVLPKAPVGFVVARAVRSALLARFQAAGAPDEAPEVLRAREGAPHAAFVPLPLVGYERGDGRLLGVAVVLPSARRAPTVTAQRHAVARGLRELIEHDADQVRTVGIPGVGNVALALPEPRSRPKTLEPGRWRGPGTSRTWATVTPVVHSRFRRNNRTESLLEQVAADCADIGLPAPLEVEVLRRSRFKGAPAGIVRSGVPDRWAGPLRGPSDHLSLTFERPIIGPIVLGRARHFGLGLCLPVRDGDR